MRRLRRFLGLGGSDKLLLLEATLVAVFVRLGLQTLRFRRLRGLLSTDAADHELPTEDVERIAWTVKKVCKYIPLDATCLTQAMTGEYMLGRRGRESNLRIGVAKSDEQKLDAHAWLEVDGNVVIGNNQDLTRYAMLPDLDVALK